MVTTRWTLCVAIMLIQEGNGFIMDLNGVTTESAGERTCGGVPIMEPLSISETLMVIPEMICSVMTSVVTCISHTPTGTEHLDAARGGTKPWASACVVDVSSSSATSTGTVDLTCYAMTVCKVESGSPTLLLAATSKKPISGTMT